MTREEAIEKFGVDPEGIGNRNRGWWIVGEAHPDEEGMGVQIGDLCVEARDGASNPIDVSALQVGNCIGSAEDIGDCTYRYYYYRALDHADPATP